MIVDFSDPDQLTRYGMVANFMAGFLLAPELLGARNLDRLQGAISTANALVSGTLSSITSGGDVKKGGGRKARLEAIVGAGLVVISYWFVIGSDEHPLVFTLVAGAVVTMSIAIGQGMILALRAEKRGLKNHDALSMGHSRSIHLASISVIIMLVVFWEWTGVVFLILLAVLLYFVTVSSISKGLLDSEVNPIERLMRFKMALVLIPSFAAYVLFAGCFSLIIEFLNIVRRIVEFSQGRFRDLLIWSGIALFVGGSILEFWATFL